MRLLLPVIAAAPLAGQTPASPSAEEAERLRARMAAAPLLAYQHEALRIVPPRAGWALGMVSWIAAGKDGTVYLLHRGADADPVVALDREGQVLRSWGKGLYVMPHGIRVDPDGNVWTTDAATSLVRKFDPRGTLLMTIEVGGLPSPCPQNFCGTTDVAFGPGGRIFVADGYANARVVEYSPDGKKVREWGAGAEDRMRIVHSIVIGPEGVAYVADRENGRVLRFDLEGRLLGSWTDLGKTFSLALDGDAVWLTTIPRNGPNLAPGWLVKVDRRSGKVLGTVPMEGGHGLAFDPEGDLLLGPGPQGSPARYRWPR